MQDQSLFIPKPDTETIILKAPVPNVPDQAEKALKEYSDTPNSDQIREYLKLINQNMLSHWYDLYAADDTYVLMQKEIATRRARNKQDKDKLQPVNLPNELCVGSLGVVHLKEVGPYGPLLP